MTSNLKLMTEDRVQKRFTVALVKIYFDLVGGDHGKKKTAWFWLSFILFMGSLTLDHPLGIHNMPKQVSPMNSSLFDLCECSKVCLSMLHFLGLGTVGRGVVQHGTVTKQVFSYVLTRQ